MQYINYADYIWGGEFCEFKTPTILEEFLELDETSTKMILFDVLYWIILSMFARNKCAVAENEKKVTGYNSMTLLPNPAKENLSRWEVWS